MGVATTQAKAILSRFTVQLEGNLKTTVHVARYPKESVRPKVKVFNQPTTLIDWCQRYEQRNAMIGCFFDRTEGRPLGEVRVNGKLQRHTPFAAPWDRLRSAAHFHPDGTIKFAPRNHLAGDPEGDLIQTGPLLVKDGCALLKRHQDPEGFSIAINQFDTNITSKRHPRAAIGTDSKYIYSVACDGRAPGQAGMYLDEFADTLQSLGIQDALNLDGGGSTTLIYDARLINRPYNSYPHPVTGDIIPTEFLTNGRAIYSAIVFESANL